MLVKVWLANNTIVWNRKHERYNNEDKHTLSLKASTKHKWVKVHEMLSVDLPWCCATMCVDVKCTHSLDCDMQENVRKVYHLCSTSCLLCKIPLMHEWWDCVVQVEEGKSGCLVDLQFKIESDEEPFVFQKFPDRKWDQPEDRKGLT